MPSLSVCVFSNQPTARLAAILAPLRDVADEIVVALDDRTQDLDLTPLDDIADFAVPMPFTWPAEASLESLHLLCSGDWILRLDGDEVPSIELIETLAGDDWHRNVTHCFIPRRWVVDGGISWIAVNPWFPDMQLRLVRNAPELVTHSNVVHGVLEVEGPTRMLTAPIYHIDLVDTDLDTRRAKGRRYFRKRPELRTHGGLSMSAHYTPELAPETPPTEPIPTEDLPLIRAVMTPDGAAATAHVPERSAAAALDTSPGRFVSLDVMHSDSRGYTGAHLEILVTVANTGTEPLSPSGEHPVRIGAQWVSSDGTSIGEEARADLPGQIDPGESETVLMLARTPCAADDYTLSIGALEEGVEWFARAPGVPFTCVDQPRISIVGGYSSHRHLGDDLIVRVLIEELTDSYPHAHLTLLADDPQALAQRFGAPATDNAAGVHKSNIVEGLSREASTRRILASASRHLAGEGADNQAISSFTEAISRSDAFVIAAAGSLASSYADATLWPRMIEAEIAQEAVVPVFIVSAGIGPFTSDTDRNAAKRLLTIANHIYLRDPLSLNAARELGIDESKMDVVPDAASSISPATPSEFDRFLRAIELQRGRRYLVASVRPDDTVTVLKRVAKSVTVAVNALDAVAVLVPHCANGWVDDRPALTTLAAMLPPKVVVVELDEIPPDPIAADLIRNAVVSVGTRFHNAVLSASAGMPAIVVCATDFDKHRALGLQQMPGTAVLVVSRFTKLASLRTRGVLTRESEPLRAPEPYPIIPTLLNLMVVRSARWNEHLKGNPTD